MDTDTLYLRQRYVAVMSRVAALGSIRQTVNLPPERDIAPQQWDVIDSELHAVSRRLRNRLRHAGRLYFPQSYQVQRARQLNEIIGRIELDLASAFAFFDTYADVLTQRHPVELGTLLAGCDVLAWDALNRGHPALAIVQPPIVYCDRGFGASVAREGIPTPGQGRNPVPLIQIPYSRLKEKYNLTSIIHEVGHEVMKRLQLDSELPAVVQARLTAMGAPTDLVASFAHWMSEIGPDFWTFCASGHAQAAGIREILALPVPYVFRVSAWDPHPMPYLRARLAFEWCRQTWGYGIWDDWDASWRALYPLASAEPRARQLAVFASSYLPVVSDLLLTYRFTALGGRTIPDLFSLPLLAPAHVNRLAAVTPGQPMDLRSLSPAAQLAVFRAIRDQGRISEDALDRMMTRWLGVLAATNRRHA